MKRVGGWKDNEFSSGNIEGLKKYIFYLLIFRKKGREGEREGEKHQCVVASHSPPSGDLACNPGMCPDWELNGRPFGSQTGTQSTEPHQPGLEVVFKQGCPAGFGLHGPEILQREGLGIVDREGMVGTGERE